MKMRVPLIAILLAIALTLSGLQSLAAEPSGDDLFRTVVAPLLSRRCVSCHRAEHAKGGLSVSSLADLKKGGDSGPALAGTSEDSLLLQMVQGAAPEMPKDADPLSIEEIAALKTWIDNGTPWPHDAGVRPV